MQLNEYFDGKVKSLGFVNEEGKITVGVMEPGEYEFDTREHERVRVTTGTLSVKLPGQQSFQDYSVGDEFQVDANQKFQLIVEQPTAYLCYYT